ncbi:hypothetical protein K491DRAFT_757454 [Lophiostoma macrostomum CBS 122681]|uniref:Uncharacterized protein n=1 Tax=Lophiostoma macrostomum CBS 122681 TaxID=1314788 RepID=A0A6A6T987_9PLEO|nr:hypothetical protein K491DRAFT_757454 [Lophiostoma macrostomum CBS 122681]
MSETNASTKDTQPSSGAPGPTLVHTPPPVPLSLKMEAEAERTRSEALKKKLSVPKSPKEAGITQKMFNKLKGNRGNEKGLRRHLERPVPAKLQRKCTSHCHAKSDMMYTIFSFQFDSQIVEDMPKLDIIHGDQQTAFEFGIPSADLAGWLGLEVAHEVAEQVYKRYFRYAEEPKLADDVEAFLSADPFSLGIPIAQTLKKLTIDWRFESEAVITGDADSKTYSAPRTLDLTVSKVLESKALEALELIPKENEVEIRNNVSLAVYGRSDLNGLADELERLRVVYDYLKEKHISFSFRQEIIFHDLDLAEYFITPRDTWIAELSKQEDTFRERWESFVAPKWRPDEEAESDEDDYDWSEEDHWEDMEDGSDVEHSADSEVD